MEEIPVHGNLGREHWYLILVSHARFQTTNRFELSESWGKRPERASPTFLGRLAIERATGQRDCDEDFNIKGG
jgi:hypothetical protein